MSGATITPSWGRLLCQGHGREEKEIQCPYWSPGVGSQLLWPRELAVIQGRQAGSTVTFSSQTEQLEILKQAISGTVIILKKHGSSVVYWWKYSDPDTIKQLPKMQLPKMQLVSKTAGIKTLASGLLQHPSKGLPVSLYKKWFHALALSLRARQRQKGMDRGCSGLPSRKSVKRMLVILPITMYVFWLQASPYYLSLGENIRENDNHPTVGAPWSHEAPCRWRRWFELLTVNEPTNLAQQHNLPPLPPAEVMVICYIHKGGLI